MGDREDESREQPPKGTGHRFFHWTLNKVLASVLATILGALAVAWLLGSDDPPAPAGSAPKQTRLEVVDLVVRNDGSKPPEIDVTLRNTGDLVSVIKRATFRILHYEVIEHGRRCYQGAGEPLPVGARYPLALPLADTEGGEISVKVSRQLRPNEADRFAFKASLASDRPVDLLLIGPSRLAQLEVLLHHDSEPEALSAGQALLAVPFPRAFFFGFPESFGAESGPCELGNVAQLNDFLALEGARSPELQRFGEAGAAGTLFDTP